jgi:hypothetical protein
LIFYYAFKGGKMNKITLQFTVAIKGPEATLQHLHQQLNPTHAHHSVLCEALPVMIREALIAAGTCPEVEVELHPCQLMNHYEGIGGLEGELWVQAYGLDYTPDNESILIKIQSEAEILCSD